MKSPKYAFSILFLSIAVTPFCTASARASVYLSGQVFRKTLHIPIPGATVTLSQPAALATGAAPTVIVTQTFLNGSFVVDLPAAGEYRIEVSADRCLPFSASVTLPASGLGSFDVPLTMEPTLSLKLLPPPGQTLEHAPVQVLMWAAWGDWKATMEPLKGTVSPGGLVDFAAPTDVPLNDIRKLLIQVSAGGNGIGQVRLSRWQDEPISVQLQPGGIISGQVIGADGKPAIDASVTALRVLPGGLPLDLPDWAEPACHTNGPDGRYVLSPLFAAPYLLVASGPSSGHFSEGAGTDFRLVSTPSAGKAVRLSLTHSSTASLMRQYPYYGHALPLLSILQQADPDGVAKLPVLTGRALDRKTGAPMAGITVQLVFGDEPVSAGRTAADGSYSISLIPSRKYHLEVVNDECAPVDQMVNAPASGQLTQDVSLSPFPSTLVKLSRVDGKALVEDHVVVTVAESRNGVEMSYSGARDELGHVQEVNPDGTMQIIEPQIALPVISGSTETEAPGPAHTTASMEPVVKITILVRSEKDGYSEMRFTKWPGSPLPVVLKPGASMNGLLLDAAGKPVPDTCVSVFRQAPLQAAVATGTTKPAVSEIGTTALAQELIPRLSFYVTTDEHGRFEVGSLPPGRYQLMSSWPGGEVDPVIDLTDGQHKITLQPAHAPAGIE